MENTTEENYQKSVNLWIEGQKKQIAILKDSAEYLGREICLKTDLLKNVFESIKHEEEFLENYLKENNLK